MPAPGTPVVALDSHRQRRLPLMGARSALDGVYRDGYEG